MACEDLKTLVTSLQQEQPELPGIEDPGIPGKDFIPVEWVDACEMYGKWKIVKQEQPEVNLEKEFEKYMSSKDESRFVLNRAGFTNPQTAYKLACHFYGLGLNARKP